jgi:hypothetical protein
MTRWQTHDGVSVSSSIALSPANNANLRHAGPSDQGSSNLHFRSYPSYAFGRMFWFMRNRFVGSNLVFSSTNRS